MNISRISIYFLIILFLYSCNQQEPAKQKVHPLLSISVEPASRMDIIDTIQIFGVIKLRQEAFLASQFDGRLKNFSLLRGDRVEKDQRIGIIIPPMREALNQIIKEMTREQQQLVARQINEIPLYSPINGTVLEVMQHNGDVLQKGESIVHIAFLNQLDIYGDLPITYIPQVKQLKTIKVTFVDYPHKPLFLPVSTFDGKVDIQKQTIQIRLALNNPKQEFRPGMMVRLVFPDKIHTQSLVIPRQALLEEEGVYNVFVVTDEQVEKRTVQIGIKHDDFVEVLSGLADDEFVATKKVYSLTDGIKVSVQ
ncbi:MAG: efflux RND transporter periplasmic adaptor subunit [Bacteroidales bacterium]|nr:efflux RND transporter periplasmic adaptor subunit [Bacteroidales bacterium]